MTYFRGPIVRFLFLLLLAAFTASCTNSETRTFAGFTFGGGGNTFDAEPAKITQGDGLSVLEAGTPADQVYLKLTWPTGDDNNAKEIKLSQVQVIVPKMSGQSTLKNGNIVVQAKDGSISHGSFDISTKTSDGREFKIVGSFTASNS